MQLLSTGKTFSAFLKDFLMKCGMCLINDELVHFEEKFFYSRILCKKIVSGKIFPKPDPTWPKRFQIQPDPDLLHCLIGV
jgi:hypothetical protein